MINLYNTTFEVSLRLIILLKAANKPLNIDKITYLDFMSVYAKEFGLSDKNLNGENHYKYGEISAKRRSITAALKRLVIDRFVKATVNSSGLVYSIDVIGKNYADSLDSEYAQEYKTAVQFVFSSFGDMDEKEISSIIKEKSNKERMR